MTNDPEPALRPREEVPCVVCGGTQLRVVASAADLELQQRYLRRFHRRRLQPKTEESLEERAQFTQDYATNIVACTECALVFRDPRPGDAAIATAYERDTYGAQRLEALFESQLEQFRPKARLLAAWLAGPKPVVLEIGSFVGGFLAACGELGWSAIGVDPGREVAEFCEARGLAVLRENVDDCEFPRGTADCVAIWNTFDQLPDPHSTLRSVRSCLRADGLLVVRVPNGQCFESCMIQLRRWPRFVRGILLAAMAWNNLLSFPYLYGYSPGTLDSLLAQHGFERVHAQGDVLTRLSDAETSNWARWEERVLKAGWIFCARILTMFSRGDSSVLPWIDVYYRQRGAPAPR